MSLFMLCGYGARGAEGGDEREKTSWNDQECVSRNLSALDTGQRTKKASNFPLD